MRRSYLGRFKRWMAIAGVLAVLVSVIGPGVIQAQASVLSNEDYFLHAGFMTNEPDQICLGKKMAVEGYFVLAPKDSLLAALTPPGGATVNLSAKLGKVTPARFVYRNLLIGKTESVNFTYQASKSGHEVITIQVTGGGETATKTLEFEVKACNYKIHGSVDLIKINGSTMVIPGWIPAGSFDVSGTLAAAQDGLRGEGTTNLFLDAIFSGNSDFDGTCVHTPPWEGASSVEMNGNAAALADNGSLEIKLTLQPMVINATKITCQGEGGGGYADSPVIHIASFDLNFDPLSADGGSTTRNFQFPGGKGEMEMQLIVSPEASS